MHLIAILLFSLSLTALCGVILFVSWWHRNYRKATIVQILREDIAHIGVSAIVAYPKTAAPLVALLEEEYSRSEAVIIADLQQEGASLGELVERYHLIKVNHSHLVTARALYRSRCRAFRRVVVVDLPVIYREDVYAIGKKVASYDNLLYLEGESIVERNAITYCANVVASQPSTKALLLRSVVGADAHLERGDVADTTRVLRLRADCPLAWCKSSMACTLSILLLLSVMVFVTYLSGSWLIEVATWIVVAFVGVLLYVSCCVETKKSLFARLDTVLKNVYNFFVEKLSTLRGSKIRDTPLAPFRERVRSRPEFRHEDALPRR